MSIVLNVLGGVLVIAAGTGMGLYKVQMLHRQRKILQDILELLFLVRGGICSQKASLELLCNQILMQKDRFQVLEIEPIKGSPKERILQWLCRQPNSQKLLNKADILLLEQWVQELGSGSAAQEIQRLDFVEQLLKQSKEQARINEQKNSKVYFLLGICAGLAVVIITF